MISKDLKLRQKVPRDPYCLNKILPKVKSKLLFNLMKYLVLFVNNPQVRK